MIYYRQCTFQWESTTQVAWIEERGAKIGSSVTFKDEDDGKFWKVTAVSEKRLPEDQVKIKERAYLKQRSVSDI